MTAPKRRAIHTLAGSSGPAGRRPRILLSSYRFAWMLGVMLVVTGFVLAQSSGAASGSSQAQEGVSSGGYTIHQSIELGYRYTDQTGSHGMYDTLVNLHSGPRVLEQTLSMRSQTHEAPLFDNLFISSFGWGGDPNNVLRMRVDKNKWYDFRANFRRDQNAFDYNLLANPLNPSTSTPSVPVLNTPHQFETRRRMSDVDLTLLPQSKFSFRLGYSRNNMTGPSFNSFHEGTDVLLFQNWNTTVNSYRLGVDWKVAPNTVLSYDQSLDYFKGDTSWQLAAARRALLPGGTDTTVPCVPGFGNCVELGLPFDTVNRLPCSVPSTATSLIDPTGTLTNIACNGYYNYNRNQKIRTSAPTERISLRSRTSRLEFTASYVYSSAKMNTPYNEFFNGLVARTFTRQYTISGPASANRISNVLDASATINVTKSFRLVDTFYLWAYRIPQNFASLETDWNIPGSGTCAPPACSLLVPISGITPTTTPSLTQTSFNQTLKRNQIELDWDISKKVGAHVGFRYGNRVLNHFLDFSTADIDHIPVNEYTVLAGFWARPTHSLRLNFDWEHTNNDNTLFRMAPRKQAWYRFNTSYTPKPWAVLGGSVNILESKNDDMLTNYRGHNRNYGFTASLTPRERFGVDLTSNYNDVLQNALICFNDTPPTGVVLPIPLNTLCSPVDPGNPSLLDSFYVNNTHYGMGTIMFKPIKRVTANLGYSITSVGGKTPQFNILQPDGSLAYNYHQPVANLSVDLGHNVLWNTGWNYYQYNEKSFVGPTAPRYFHANTATFSVRYAF